MYRALKLHFLQLRMLATMRQVPANILGGQICYCKYLKVHNKMIVVYFYTTIILEHHKYIRELVTDLKCSWNYFSFLAKRSSNSIKIFVPYFCVQFLRWVELQFLGFCG